MIEIFGNNFPDQIEDTSHAKPTTGRKNSSRRAEPTGERATEKPEREREREREGEGETEKAKKEKKWGRRN